MTMPAKLALGATAFLVGIVIAWQIYVGGTILGLLLDGVCMIFPVCPGE